MKVNAVYNCRLVTPGVELPDAAVEICDGVIKRISTGRPEWSYGGLDAGGKMLMPGFVDVHCHGRNNFDVCDGSAEGFAAIAVNKLAEGVTTLLPTTLTLPESELADALRAVAAYDGRGCKVPGVHLEGPFINPKCVGAQNPAYVRAADIAEIDRLNAIFPVRKVTFAVECAGGAELVESLLARGITPSCTHSAATAGDFRCGYERGLRNLSHFCNQMTPLHHRDIGLVGSGLLYDDVNVELICDKLHISPDMIRLVFKVKGCDHVMLISDAMRAAGMPVGEYTLGGLPVVVSSDGAARLKDNGALAGSTLKINVALANIREVTGLPLSELVKSTSLTAARSLGLWNIGRIESGYAADMVLLDDDFSVRMTIVDGEVRYRG